jgi:hypothetical protein
MLASFFSGECPAECVPFRPRSLPHAVGRLASPYVYRGRGRRPGATTLIGYKPQRSSATMPRVLVDPPAAADGLLELLREGATRFAARAARGNGHALHGLAERLSTPLCNAPRAVPKKKGQRSQADAARAKRTPHAPSGRRTRQADADDSDGATCVPQGCAQRLPRAKHAGGRCARQSSRVSVPQGLAGSAATRLE